MDRTLPTGISREIENEFCGTPGPRFEKTMMSRATLRPLEVLPFTGNETVLDALVFAGGLLPTAEPKEIHLVRPARGGKPAKVYTVNLDAIRDKGDITTNYQDLPRRPPRRGPQ